MFAYLILGAAYAFAAVAQPGPMQAYLISRAATYRLRCMIPAALRRSSRRPNHYGDARCVDAPARVVHSLAARSRRH